MLGMIQYSAVPFFHMLVQNRDYKMICIFEVFALNRNEDDFLENLGILNEIRRHNEESQFEQDNQQDTNDDTDAAMEAPNQNQPQQFQEQSVSPQVYQNQM